MEPDCWYIQLKGFRKVLKLETSKGAGVEEYIVWVDIFLGEMS